MPAQKTLVWRRFNPLAQGVPLRLVGLLKLKLHLMLLRQSKDAGLHNIVLQNCFVDLEPRMCKDKRIWKNLEEQLWTNIISWP